jgi:hypothetical protein
MSKNSKQARKTVALVEDTILDGYEPDYESRCQNCGASPTVMGMKDGKVVYAAGMCGPCTWGEIEAIDPANW